jgi:alpha-mannosidase
MIEVFLVNDNSCICQTYKFPKHGTEIEVNLRVFWNKKTKMLKLSIPTFVKAGYCLGQAPFGVCQLPNQHTESVAQKWTGIFSDSEDAAITCINDGTYGSDYQNGEMRFSLLRSPGYSAHTIANRQMMPQDRFSARIDQGERVFRFWINGGDYQNRIDNIEREALIHNEEPFALSCFPSGKGKNTLPLIVIDDDSVVMTAFKIASDGSGYVFRLFESTGRSRSLTVHLPILKTKIVIKINKYEIKSYFINLNDGTLREVDLMENAIPT